MRFQGQTVDSGQFRVLSNVDHEATIIFADELDEELLGALLDSDIEGELGGFCVTDFF